MTKSKTIVTSALALVVTSTPGLAQSRIVIPDGVSCVDCTIESRVIARIGSANGPDALPRRPRSVAIDSRRRLWFTFGRDVPHVFDRSAARMITLGRRGPGPEEFGGSVSAFPLSADSMAVLDDINNRIVIVAPNLQVARSVALPLGVLSTGIALRWPETVIVSGMASAADSRLEPLHVVALDRLSGRIVRSFGAASVPTDFAPWTLRQSFERTSPDTIWIADSFRYQLRRTNGTGTVVATYDRNPEWFSGQPEIPDGTRNNPPAARIQGISVDESGRLWVFLHVAAPTWPDAWARVPQGAREYPAGLLAMDKLLRPIVEVIDPAAGRVVARIELDGWIISALPGGRAAFYAEDELGTPSVRIVQFTIRKLSSDARLRANGGQTGAHIR